MSKVKEFFKGWSMFEKCWLVLSTVIMIVLSIIWGDNTLALISGITGILGVVLAAKGKVSTYVFATINVAIYAYLTFNNHLYGDFMLNAFYYILFIFCSQFLPVVISVYRVKQISNPHHRHGDRRRIFTNQQYPHHHRYNVDDNPQKPLFCVTCNLHD